MFGVVGWRYGFCAFIWFCGCFVEDLVQLKVQKCIVPEIWCLWGFALLSGFGNLRITIWEALSWKKGKDPHPQDKSQYLDFTKDPRPLYYKTPPCVFYHKNLRSKAVFGP